MVKFSFISSNFRKDEKVSALSVTDTSHLLFHQKCYDSYTHKKTLEKLCKERTLPESIDEDFESTRTLTRKKDRSGSTFKIVITKVKALLRFDENISIFVRNVSVQLRYTNC